MGSNADLPIVGGSILSHDHFQGGRYTFAMERAPIERDWTFPGFEDVRAGIVHWPMSCIRLSCPDGKPHNTITPIARKREGNYELDLVLRNNITTAEHPMGLFHPHAKLHHIKKENIGLIEVMGLAVLPSRLKGEMPQLADALVAGSPVSAFGEEIAKHADWAMELREKYAITRENVDEILRKEIVLVFAQVLENAGVYKLTPSGREGFARFLSCVR